MKKVAMVGMEVITGSEIWTSSHQDWPGSRHCWVPNLPETNTAYLVRVPFHRVISRLPGDRLITWDCFHHKRGSVVLTGIGNYFGFRPFLPCTQCFSQNHHPWTYRMPYLPLWYSTRHCFSKWSVAMGPCSWNSLVLPCFPTILKQLAY